MGTAGNQQEADAVHLRASQVGAKPVGRAGQDAQVGLLKPELLRDLYVPFSCFCT